MTTYVIKYTTTSDIYVDENCEKYLEWCVANDLIHPYVSNSDLERYVEENIERLAKEDTSTYCEWSDMLY